MDRSHRSQFGRSALSVTIRIGYACNLRCTYCDQQGRNLRWKMDKKACQNVIIWISNKMEIVKPKILNITFAGGEPLLNPDAVRLICKTLAIAAYSRKIKMRASIITNGFRLKPDFVSDLKKWGLSRIRLTLDGNEKAHNQKRPAKSGKETYKTIFNNLKRVKGIVPVSLNVNFDDKNIKSIPLMLDDLVNSGFSSRDIANINLKPIIRENKSLKKRIGIGDPGEFSPLLKLADDLHLRDEILKRGFIPGNGIDTIPCDVLQENSFTIDQDGKIYKSYAFVGISELLSGDLKSGQMNFDNTDLGADYRRPRRKECGQHSYGSIAGDICLLTSQVNNKVSQKGEIKYLGDAASRFFGLKKAG